MDGARGRKGSRGMSCTLRRRKLRARETRCNFPAVTIRRETRANSPGAGVRDKSGIFAGERHTTGDGRSQKRRDLKLRLVKVFPTERHSRGKFSPSISLSPARTRAKIAERKNIDEVNENTEVDLSNADRFLKMNTEISKRNPLRIHVGEDVRFRSIEDLNFCNRNWNMAKY